MFVPVMRFVFGARAQFGHIEIERQKFLFQHFMRMPVAETFTC
jgi:hypothetical protein